MSARAGGDGGAGPPVLVLTGMGGLTGIGKTALTQHAARAPLTDPSPWTSATAAGTGPRTRAVDQLLVGLRVDFQRAERGRRARGG
ncbi:hypothetical protein GA0115257_124625 [Streptomyces sp. LcepLS]|nr:hypothetical protein GA0115257_124625 [Streptomyces sp. LcepLS]